MIEFVVVTVIVLFIIYALISFISLPVSVFFSLILIVAFYILIKKTLKEKGMLRYFMISLLITAIIFILSSSGILKTMFEILEKKLFLSEITFALFSIFFFMKVIKYSHDKLKPLIKDLKKNI